jgi:hypothetical protein
MISPQSKPRQIRIILPACEHRPSVLVLPEWIEKSDANATTLKNQRIRSCEEWR